MRNIQSAYRSRVLLADSASENMWQDLEHNLEPVDILNITNPALIVDRHIAYLKAGADILHTNSFGAFPLDMARAGYAEESFIVNYLAAEAAARAVDTVPGLGRRRFVAGVICPGRLPGGRDDIVTAAALQAEGLIAGGSDCLAILTGEENSKTDALIQGILLKRDALNPQIPVFLYHKSSGANLKISNAGLVDRVIHYFEGNAHYDKWLSIALNGKRPNLITGGDSAPDTAVIDNSLRAWAQDGLRPGLESPKRGFEEGFMPASSSRSFDAIKPAG